MKVFRECTSKDEFIYALNWQHESYLYNPHLENTEKWYVAPVPDDAYYKIIIKKINNIFVVFLIIVASYLRKK